MQYTAVHPWRWSSDDHRRAQAGLTARAATARGPRTGDLIEHPGGRRTQLWITPYSFEAIACSHNHDDGFILSDDGSVDYTGTDTRLGNKPVSLAGLTDTATTATVELWVDRRDEELPGDVVYMNVEVRVWRTEEPAPVPASYDVLAQWVYTAEQDVELTEAEAKIIAAYWSEMVSGARLRRWANGASIDRAPLLTEARRLLERVNKRKTPWPPHMGRPEPSRAAITALITFLLAEPTQ